MSGPAAARGPLAFLLQSQSGQWITISLGAMYAFPEQVKGMVLLPLLKEASQYSDMAKFVASGLGVAEGELLSKSGSTTSSSSTPSMQPIIIHTGGNSGTANKTLSDTVAYYALGAGACWVGYVVLSQALPDAVQEMLPVTRKFFAKTSSVLAEGIIQVRKSLEAQLQTLSKKQDDLDGKLDDTHASVRSVQSELADTRADIHGLGEGMDRCESTLLSSSRLQSYTSKGVTLLVRCVATMLPSNDRQVNELAQYIQDGEEMGKREQEQRRLTGIRGTPLSATPQLPPPKRRTSLFIRDSELDSSLHSLEDVNKVLGIGPNGLLTA
jgi:hypothetical protein